MAKIRKTISHFLKTPQNERDRMLIAKLIGKAKNGDIFSAYKLISEISSRFKPNNETESLLLGYLKECISKKTAPYKNGTPISIDSVGFLNSSSAHRKTIFLSGFNLNSPNQRPNKSIDKGINIALHFLVFRNKFETEREYMSQLYEDFPACDRHLRRIIKKEKQNAIDFIRLIKSDWPYMYFDSFVENIIHNDLFHEAVQEKEKYIISEKLTLDLCQLLNKEMRKKDPDNKKMLAQAESCLAEIKQTSAPSPEAIDFISKAIIFNLELLCLDL